MTGYMTGYIGDCVGPEGCMGPNTATDQPGGWVIQGVPSAYVPGAEYNISVINENNNLYKGFLLYAELT
jgi:hypothetical protein